MTDKPSLALDDQPPHPSAAMLASATKGFDYLFANDIVGAREHFNSKDDPFHLMGSGVMAFLEAALGMEVRCPCPYHHSRFSSRSIFSLLPVRFPLVLLRYHDDLLTPRPTSLHTDKPNDRSLPLPRPLRSGHPQTNEDAQSEIPQFPFSRWLGVGYYQCGCGGVVGAESCVEVRSWVLLDYRFVFGLWDGILFLWEAICSVRVVVVAGWYIGCEPDRWWSVIALLDA